MGEGWPMGEGLVGPSEWPLDERLLLAGPGEAWRWGVECWWPGPWPEEQGLVAAWRLGGGCWLGELWRWVAALTLREAPSLGEWSAPRWQTLPESR